jgi:hypothetical protein
MIALVWTMDNQVIHPHIEHADVWIFAVTLIASSKGCPEKSKNCSGSSRVKNVLDFLFHKSPGRNAGNREANHPMKARGTTHLSPTPRASNP